MIQNDANNAFSFELRPWNHGVTNEELIADLQRVAGKLEKDSITRKEYVEHGRYSSNVFEKRFGSWNSSLEKAGLRISFRIGISNEELFENMELVWIALGRQPARSEMISPLSQFSKGTYEKRFGTWRKALEAFVNFANEQDEEKLSRIAHPMTPQESQTNRFPSLRLRFKVMRRDHFRCQYCGRSPATHAGVQLHIDHIEPWSKGGRTVLDNLRTLCSDCNLGKGDLGAVADN